MNTCRYQLPVKVHNHSLGYVLNGWQISGTVFWHGGVPFSLLSTPYSAAGNGIVQGGGPEFASVVPGVPVYDHHPIPGVTQPETLQWLNPDAFVSAVDPGTGLCFGGDTPQNCRFGNLGRNSLRGPDFLWSDFYLTKWFPLTEHVKLRFESQFFNVFNHPNFALPSVVQAGIPVQPSTQTGFEPFVAAIFALTVLSVSPCRRPLGCGSLHFRPHCGSSHTARSQRRRLGSGRWPCSSIRRPSVCCPVGRGSGL